MSADTWPIVGIGASAGGVEALGGFFRGLPERPGLAIVIITHLSPERESLLHEVVSRYTALPVHVVADGMRVEENHVYVLPADAILGIDKRHLLIRKNPSGRERKLIDIFFSSLAVDLGELAAGVVLSGGDADGTLGIKAIKQHGGLTLAQVRDGFGPQHTEMPDSAIATGLVDFAVPVEQMGAKLVEFAHGAEIFDGIAVGAHAVDAVTPEQAMPEICGILRSQIGHDFSGYKTKTFMRRVQRRMHVTQLNTVDAYVERLRQEPCEVSALFRDLLINVTNFFRDADAFESLTSLVVPKLFAARGADETVRIWVPGCSTGEEAFSIAILLREHMDQLTAVPRVQLFATDIDERALAVARAGRYPTDLLDSVSSERRKRFFILDGGSLVVSKDVRELCIFSPHNVIRDPPFSRIDLISCRNLLIYFGVAFQNRVIPTFHYALRPDGHLFLGLSENVSRFDDLFVSIEKKHRIFRRRSDVTPSIRLPPEVGAFGAGQVGDLIPRRSPLGPAALQRAVDVRVLERFAPPHVVVNRDGDVVHYSSRTGKYLEAPHGVPTRQLLTIARTGLRLDLRTLFREAVETGRSATRRGISVESDHGGVQLVNLTIEPLSDRGAGEPLYLVLFADQGQHLSGDEVPNQPPSAQDGTAAQGELREARDRLQSMIEEYETALEELKSSNQELVSVNEEMQSANEELEASKEELQSVNEELHTVNTELSDRVEELDRATSDLRNLFESTDVATVFLDKNLVIRSFTPAVANIVSIRPGDRGRPITDLSSRLSLVDLSADIAKVFADHCPLERRVESDDGTAQYFVRLAPYRNSNLQTEGVVVTFVDITSLARAEARQRVLIAELQHRTRNMLTVVQFLAKQTLGKGGSFDSFVARLTALGRVQGLASEAIDARIELEDLVRVEVQAIGAPADGKVTFSGPRVLLIYSLIQPLGLALHELATNAVKYGALKEEAGRLDISWERRDDIADTEIKGNLPGTSLLILNWRESGVAAPTPARSGFGRELIERALAFTLRAKTELSFGADGLSCRIEIPLPPLTPDDPIH